MCKTIEMSIFFSVRYTISRREDLVVGRGISDIGIEMAGIIFGNSFSIFVNVSEFSGSLTWVKFMHT